MPRARNLKYSFFTDEVIADNPPLARLLYQGLWTIADFNGNLEWRPKRIKVLILPYDDVDIEELAINLDKSRLITFYSVNEKRYVHIENFTKHQNPHKNEKAKGTDIPEVPQVVDSNNVTINPDKSRSKRNKDGTDPADSCFLIPEYTYSHFSEIRKRLEQSGMQEREFVKTKPRQTIDKWLAMKITVNDLDMAIAKTLEAVPDNFCVGYVDKVLLRDLNKQRNPQGKDDGKCNEVPAAKPKRLHPAEKIQQQIQQRKANRQRTVDGDTVGRAARDVS